VEICSRRCSPWNSKIAVADKSLHLNQDRTSSFHRARDHGPRRSLRLSVEHKLRWIFHLRQSLCLHLKHTDLIGGTETVFHSPQDPVGCMAVSLEIQNRIHHMFQHTGTGYISIFCHMADDEYRNSKTFGNLHQHIG